MKTPSISLIVTALLMAMALPFGSGCESAETGDLCRQLDGYCLNLGEQRCLDNAVDECRMQQNGCALWTRIQACTENSVCTDTMAGKGCVCSHHDCAQLGDSQCLGNKVMSCIENSEGCRTWLEQTDCAALDRVCDQSSGKPICATPRTDDCTPENSTRCFSSFVQTCTRGGDGFLAWQYSQDCSAIGAYCTTSTGSATCARACSDTCGPANLTRCNGDTVQTCSIGNSGCLEWQNSTNCSSQGDLCQNGSCVDSCTNTCSQIAATRCSDQMLQTCATGNHGCLVWQDTTFCPQTGSTCDSSANPAACVATCTDTCPSVGVQQCAGDQIQTCVQGYNACMTWIDGQNCASTNQDCQMNGTSAACVGTCTDACTPQGSSRCTGDQIQTCSPAGDGCLAWSNGVNCVQNGMSCEDSSGSAVCVSDCSDTCSPQNASRCSGDTIQVCTTGYAGCLAWSNSTDCASQNQECDDSSGLASCQAVAGDLCSPCTAHDDCSGYIGALGGQYCQPLYQGGSEYFCLQDCTNDAGLCQPGETCDGLGNCIPPEGCSSDSCSPSNPSGTCPSGMVCQDGVCENTSTGDSGIGQPCAGSADCTDTGATCYPEEYDGEGTGFLDGYCMVFDCPTTACPGGSQCIEFSTVSVCLDVCTSDSDCRMGYGCLSAGTVNVCYPYCDTANDCPTNYACVENACMESCTPGSCPAGESCINGQCLVDVGDGPGANTDYPLTQLASLCPDLPPLECTGSSTFCGELVPFDPDYGPGYVDYPENGESWDNQYRSYIRRDNMMMIKYATAYVACLAADWTVGNGADLGLIDMSEANGDIPGTSVNSPGHPDGTHTNGFDIDVAYYQAGTADNRARPICDHYEDGQEAYHCTAPPHLLDPWRTALFLGALFEHPQLRIVGADGQAGPILDGAIAQLCSDGWLSSNACSNQRLAYEVTNGGSGWYYFHHHHMHVSLDPPARTSSSKTLPVQNTCLIPGCDRPALRTFLDNFGLPFSK